MSLNKIKIDKDKSAERRRHKDTNPKDNRYEVGLPFQSMASQV